MTDEDVLKATDELYRQIAAETHPSKKENCKNFGRFGDRYCLATTQTTCEGCRMFEPTVFARFRTLLKNTQRLKYKVEQLTIEKESLELKVKVLENRLYGENPEDYFEENE